MKGNIALITGLAFVAVVIGARLLIGPQAPKPVVVPLPAHTAPVAAAPAAKPLAPPPIAPAAVKPPPKPAAPPPLPALPMEQVSVAPEHMVPDDGPPPPPGRKLDLRGFDAGDDATSPAPPPHAPRYFSGLARVTGDTSLEVGRVPVVLFGIRAPEPGTRCPGGISCKDAAEQTLTSRLGKGKVSCRSPVPNAGVVAFAICLDGEGIDLGGALIDDGFALADTGQSYDYVGAEGVARNLHRGLWQAR